jgi:HlyD family secretion protein
MTASADIQTKSKLNVISIPLNAVTTRDKEGNGKDTKVTTNTDDKKAAPEGEKNDDDINEVVFVLQKDSKVKMVKVKTDIQDLNFIEVVGLKVGDEVITGPYSTVSKLLKDGTLVKVVTKDKLYEEKK